MKQETILLNQYRSSWDNSVVSSHLKSIRPIVTTTVEISDGSVKGVKEALEEYNEFGRNFSSNTSGDYAQLHFNDVDLRDNIENQKDIAEQIFKTFSNSPDSSSISIGLVDYKREALESLCFHLQKLNDRKDFKVNIVSNRCKFSLLNQSVLHNGILQTCKAKGILLIAESTLCGGVLTTNNSEVSKKYNNLDGLKKLLEFIGKVGGYNKTVEQVAMNWICCQNTNVVAISRTNDEFHSWLNVNATSGKVGTWYLEENEIKILEERAKTCIYSV